VIRQTKIAGARAYTGLITYILAGLLLMGAGLVFGCAAKSGDAAATAPTDQPAQTETAQSEPAEQPRPLVSIATVSMDKGKTKVELPLPENVDVSPMLNGNQFLLAFSPGIDPFILPTSAAGMVKDMELIMDRNTDQAEALKVTLSGPSQFLLTRKDPMQVNVYFTPVAFLETDKPVAAAATQKRQNVLQTIEFTQDETGHMYIKLTADRDMDYTTQPASGDQVRLYFPDLKIPETYSKLYRLHKFNSSVETAWLHNVSDGAELVLTVFKREPLQVDRKSNQLVFKFTGQPVPTAQQTAYQDTFSQVQAMDAQSSQAEEMTQLFPGQDKVYTGQPVSLNVQDADIETVLRMLIIYSENLNLIIDEGVKGKVSLKVENVPWDQILDLVLLQLGLEKSIKGNILRVSTAENMQRERDQQRRLWEAALEERQSRQELEPLKTEYIQVNYATAEDMVANISGFVSERGSVSFDSRTNIIIATETEEQLDRIRNVINKLDRPERQVLIEARIVYASEDFGRSLGFKWGGGLQQDHIQHRQGLYGTLADELDDDITNNVIRQTGYAVNAPLEEPLFGLGYYISKLYGDTLYSLDVQLELAETQDLSKTISSPRVVTLNNHEATITQGTKLAYLTESESGGTTVEYQEALLSLTVKPQITPDNKLILDLNISDDTPVDGASEIETKTTQTQLIVNDGETIVLGGVQKTQNSGLTSEVPGLGKIPVLGWLFKSKEKSKTYRELLIFIRPQILDP